MADSVRGIMKKQTAQNQQLWSILIKEAIKKVFRQNLTRQWHESSVEKKNPLNVYNRMETTISKTSNFSFSDSLFFLLFEFFDAVVNFKTYNFNLSESA